MERLKFLKFTLNIYTQYSNKPLTYIKGSDSFELPLGNTTFDFTVHNTMHKEAIEFKGFDHTDQDQKIQLSLECNGVIYDINGISSFVMQNNKYVDNKLIKSVNEIVFNGTLYLNFFTTWFSCNFLQGGLLTNDETDLWKRYEDYDNPQDLCLNQNTRLDRHQQYDVVISGTCFTSPLHHLYKNMVPYTLQKICKRDITNISFDGINAYASLHNANVLVDFYKIKTLILAPSNQFQLPVKKEFLDKTFVYSYVRSKTKLLGSNIFGKVRNEMLQANRNRKQEIQDLIESMYLNLVRKCKAKNVQLILWPYKTKSSTLWDKYKDIDLEINGDLKALLQILEKPVD